MSILSFIFALMAGFGALGSIVVIAIRFVQWSKGSINVKALIAAALGYTGNCVLQFIACISFLFAYKEGELQPLLVGLGISAFCTVVFYVTRNVK